jgi:tryptophanase
MNTDQWAAYDGARATETASDEYHRLLRVWQDTLGHEYCIPTHQDGLLITS